MSTSMKGINLTVDLNHVLADMLVERLPCRGNLVNKHSMHSHLKWTGSLQECRWRWAGFVGRCCSLHPALPPLWNTRYRARWRPRRRSPAESTNPSQPWKFHSGAGWSEISEWLLPCTPGLEAYPRTCSALDDRERDVNTALSFSCSRFTLFTSLSFSLYPKHTHKNLLNLSKVMVSRQLLWKPTEVLYKFKSWLKLKRPSA